MQQAPESEINPLEYFQVLNRGKRLIATVVVTACFVAVVISFILPKTYRARAVVMPVSRGGAVAGGPASVLSTNALASGLGAELLGVGGGGGNPQLMVLLRSRTLAEMVVEKLDLMPLFFESQWDRETKQWKSKPPRIDAAANRLLGLITLNDDKKLYIINISADWTDPQMAATLANTYVEQLQRFINENQLTVAKKNRIFIEKQVENNRIKYLEAGKLLNNLYGVDRISGGASKVDVDIEIGGFQGGATIAVKGELTSIQDRQKAVETKLEQLKLVKDVPQQVYFGYLTLQKELLGKVNALLSQQYEMAKIEEAKEELSFQVIDKAKPPLERFSPRRKHICLTTFFISFLLSVVFVLGRDYWEKLKKGIS